VTSEDALSRVTGYAPTNCGVNPCSSCDRNREAVAKLEADARAIWAVRVLDAWKRASRVTNVVKEFEASNGTVYCVVYGLAETARCFEGLSDFDAARLAAAEAVFAGLPADVRAKLGERP
jgi:hypothetical protein